MASISANSGSYTIVGAQAFRALVLSCAAGSYALTGTSAPTVYGHPITALSGSYTLTGSPIQSRRIAAEPAGYILNGTPATLTHGSPAKTVVATSGSYTLTGTASILELAKSYDRGNYALTGTAATIHTGNDHIINVDVGSYTITGGTTHLEAVILIDTGDYNTTGTAATLRKGKGLVALSGTYSISPGPQVLLKNPKRITAAAGTYTLTGIVAVLNYSPSTAKTIFAFTGTYGLTGQPVTLRLARLVAATGGSYTLTGTAAGLKVKLTAIPGVYTLTGSATSLLKSGKLLTAGGGFYSLRGTQLVIDTTNKSNSGAIAAGISKTWAHTVAPGLERILLVCVSHTANQNTRAVSGVTFNGLAMTLGKNSLIGGSGTFRFSSIWYLLNPTPTTANIVVTFVNTIVGGIASAVALTGVNSSISPIRTSNAFGTTDTAPTVTLVSGGNADNIVIDCLTHTDTTATVGPGQTQLQNFTFSSGVGTSSYETAGDTTTMSWTLSTSSAWTIDAVEVVGDATKLRLSAAGVNPILFANIGSYTINGFVANTKAGFRLLANPGSYSLTGEAVTLTRLKAIRAIGGSYSILGISAQVVRRDVLLASSGSYTITGTAATLSNVYKIVIDSGSYSLTGASTTLFKTSVPPSFFLAAGAGNYAISGVSTTQASTFSLPLAPGNYILIGTDAALRSTQFIIESGSYSYTGSSVNFLTTRTGRWRKPRPRTTTFSKQPAPPQRWNIQEHEPGLQQAQLHPVGIATYDGVNGYDIGVYS